MGEGRGALRQGQSPSNDGKMVSCGTPAGIPRGSRKSTIAVGFTLSPARRWRASVGDAEQVCVKKSISSRGTVGQRQGRTHEGGAGNHNRTKHGDRDATERPREKRSTLTKWTWLHHPPRKRSRQGGSTYAEHTAITERHPSGGGEEGTDDNAAKR